MWPEVNVAYRAVREAYAQHNLAEAELTNEPKAYQAFKARQTARTSRAAVKK